MPRSTKQRHRNWTVLVKGHKKGMWVPSDYGSYTTKEAALVARRTDAEWKGEVFGKRSKEQWYRTHKVVNKDSPMYKKVRKEYEEFVY